MSDPSPNPVVNGPESDPKPDAVPTEGGLVPSEQLSEAEQWEPPEDDELKRANEIIELKAAIRTLRAALEAGHNAQHMNCTGCYEKRDALRDTAHLV